MADRLVLDTDVLVDYLRGHKKAIAYLEGVKGPILTSAITVAELYAGVRDGEERAVLDRFLLAFDIAPVDDEIAKKGGIYRRNYGTSHGIGLADALIAATAELKQAKLVTLNEKHFPMLDVYVPYRKR